MKEMATQFARYRSEHSRLRDPELARSPVELVPVVFDPFPAPVAVAEKRRGIGKRKKRRMERESQPGAGNFLSSSSNEGESFSDCLRAPATEVATPSPARVALFQDQDFEINAPDAQQVEMVWREIEGGELQRAAMDHTGNGLFRAVIGIADGEYLFGYTVDGTMRPDARFAQRVHLRREGIFTRFDLNRYCHSVALHNPGATDQTVRIETDAEWLEAERPLSPLTLRAKRETPALLRLLPESMAPGLNMAMLQAVAPGGDWKAVVTESEIAVTAEVGGVIAELNCKPRKFAPVLQGVQSLKLRVEVTARGRGTLNGVAMLRHSEEMADFYLEADSELETFSRTFVIDSGRLPYREEGAIKVTVITDSYLANHRRLQIEVPYRLIYLKKSLPALTFGQLKLGATRTMRLEMERSDRQEIDIEIELPEEAGPYLEAYRLSQNIYSFRFDTRALSPGAEISQTILLTDRLSGLRDRVKALAEVIA